MIKSLLSRLLPKRSLCADCGAPLNRAQRAQGLCPSCEAFDAYVEARSYARANESDSMAAALLGLAESPDVRVVP